MTEALETRSIVQLGRLVAVPTGAIVPLQVEGEPAGGVPVEALFGKYLSVAVSYETAAELHADLAHDANAVGLVFSDPDPINSIYWVKTGAFGAGEWIRTNIAAGQKGDPGASNSTYLTTAELAAADVANISGILAEAAKAGTFTVRNYADFEDEIAADTGQVNFIPSTFDEDKVWVRTSILPGTGAKVIGTEGGSDVQSELDVASAAYRSPATPFTWWAGAAAAKGQVVSSVSMVADGAKPLFGIVREWNTSVGDGTIPYQVGRAESMIGAAGGGNFYTWNPIAHVDSGWSGDAFTTMEVNANNLSGINFGDSVGAFDVANSASPWATVVNLIGLGDRFTAALAIGAPSAAGQCFNRSITLGDAAKIVHIQGGVSAAAGIMRFSGSSTAALFDVSAVSATQILFMPNGGAISAVNSGGGLAELLKLNAGNTMILGGGATGGIAIANDLLMSTDNAWDIGKIGGRAKTIYLVNSPSVTSDPSLKDLTVAQPTDGEIVQFVERLPPITWRWLVGGIEEYEEEEEGLVPLRRCIPSETEEFDFVDGTAIPRKVSCETWEDVTEDVPVVDEDGEPVMWQPIDHKTGKVLIDPATCQPLRDEKGNPALDRQGREQPDLTTGVPYEPRQRTATRTVMVPGKIKVTKTREVPGKRIHIGWNAEDVKLVQAEMGVDWGVLVQGEDGILHLREGRMTAILWRYSQIKAAQLASIEERLARLEGAE